MGKEKYFDEEVLNYDRYRPTYGSAVFEDLLAYASISETSRILEIGCGTGNATLPLLETGAEVTAVELGENLCRYTAKKFAHLRNFHIVNRSFEAFESEGGFDLVLSATALHWIKEEIAYPKIHRMLKNGGVLAAFWNTPRISGENAALASRIQALYRTYRGKDTGTETQVDTLENSVWYIERCQGLQRTLEKYRFIDRVFRIYHAERRFTAEEYIGLLHTYSNHMAMEKHTREKFFAEIHSAIAEFGSITVKDTIDLHMGRKA